MSAYMKQIARCCIVACSLQLNACMSLNDQQGSSFGLFQKNMPRSILLLPPVNESVNVDASYTWLTTASQPIAENGYYVFPVAVVDAFMKENGLSDPKDMHAVPPRNLGRVFGADAIMYVTIEDFGEKLNAFDSVTSVHVRAELMDVNTEQLIWSGRIEHTEHTTQGARNNLLGAVANTVVAQVNNNITDSSHSAAVAANWQLFRNNFTNDGLLWGPAHPEFKDQTRQAPVSASGIESSVEDGWFKIGSDGEAEQ